MIEVCQYRNGSTNVEGTPVLPAPIEMNISRVLEGWYSLVSLSLAVEIMSLYTGSAPYTGCGLAELPILV